MALFTEPEQVLDYIYQKVVDNQVTLGLGFVGYADERLLPRYPAVAVSYNTPVDRELHATRTFSLVFGIQLVVYHARMTASHRTRTREDMQIAASIRNLLHTDYTLGGGVIFGYVRSERPGVVMDDKGQVTVATTLIWAGESRSQF